MLKILKDAQFAFSAEPGTVAPILGTATPIWLKIKRTGGATVPIFGAEAPIMRENAFFMFLDYFLSPIQPYFVQDPQHTINTTQKPYFQEGWKGARLKNSTTQFKEGKKFKISKGRRNNVKEEDWKSTQKTSFFYPFLLWYSFITPWIK